MTTHNQPNDRPVHPECRGLTGVHRACTCDEAWRDWDGTRSELDRNITAAKRNERRAVLQDLDALIQDDFDDPRISGFWSNAEFLTTVKGE